MSIQSVLMLSSHWQNIKFMSLSFMISSYSPGLEKQSPVWEKDERSIIFSGDCLRSLPCFALDGWMFYYYQQLNIIFSASRTMRPCHRRGPRAGARAAAAAGHAGAVGLAHALGPARHHRHRGPPPHRAGLASHARARLLRDTRSRARTLSAWWRTGEFDHSE